MKNQNSTRYYADQHEKSICKALEARQTSGSGSNRFEKGDVVIPEIMLIEAKCSMTEKKSISIKKEWLEKVNEEKFRNRLRFSSLCFNFGPDGANYYIIDELLMKYLVDILKK